MKKIFPITLLFTLLLAFTLYTPSADASGGIVKVVDSKSAIVRAEASGSSKKLLTLSKGYYVTQLSSSNGWAKVQAGKTTGYMSMSALKVKSFNRKALSARAEIKQTASKSAKTLTTVQKGTVVENYGNAGNGWSYVKVGNASGYIATRHLKNLGNTTKYLTSTFSLYELPEYNGDFLGYVDAYSKVTVLSTVGNYAYVKAGSKYGYIPSSSLVKYMAFAKTYTAKCANVKTSVIKCTTNEAGGAYIFKNEPLMFEDYLGSYYIEGDDLIVGWYEGHDRFDFPLYKGKSWSYESYIENYVSSTVVSMNETVRYRGKTLKNVIKIQSYNYYSGYYYTYLAPGYGILSM